MLAFSKKQKPPTFSIRPMNPIIGAEITDIDLSKTIDERTVLEITNAIQENLVIFFPEQNISPSEQVNFAKKFGDVAKVPDSMFRVHPKNPYVSILENGPKQPPTVNNWHSDYCFAHKPDFLSVLHSQIVPEIGGDTIWVNMYAAYEALSPKMKNLLCDLRATHDFMKLYERPIKAYLWEGERFKHMETARKNFPPVSHPVVRTISETQKKALFVNESFTRRIEGMSELESMNVLKYLFDHIRTPEYQIRFQWKPNTLAVWDNRATIHYALADYFPKRRLVHRVTVLNHEVPT